MEQDNTEITYVEKKNLNLLLFLHTFFILVGIIVATIIISNKIAETSIDKTPSDIPTFDENDNLDTETYYVLKEYNGKVGIYENESLIYTLDTYIFTLPESEKKLLSEGIKVSSQKELYELLEEYYWFLNTTESGPSIIFNADKILSVTDIETPDAFTYLFVEES